MDRAALKSAARLAIRETKPSVYLVAFIYLVITVVLGTLQSNITGVTIDYDTYTNRIIPALQNGDFEYVIEMYQRYMPSTTARLIGVLISVMSMMLGVGFAIYSLHVCRREQSSIGNLFDGFSMFFRVLWLEILIYVFTLLWSLLFIIPGIIAAYRYRQAIYILIDDPDKGALQCISESKAMMAGHKGELFIMDLSFIGWFFLCVFVIPLIYVAPYTGVSYAGFYCALLPVSYDAGGDGDRAAPAEPKAGDDELPPWEFK